MGKSTIDKYGLTYYVDGVVDTTLVKNNLVRSNTTDVGATGNGVLTQVFVDYDDEEIVITSINTYLAQANADYNKNTETLSLNVYVDDNTGVTKTVDSADVPNTVDVVEDQFALVNMSRKDRTALEIVKISDVEILTDATVTKFSTAGGSDTTLPSTTDLLVAVTGHSGVTGAGRYDATNGKLYLQFYGLTAQASKVTLPNVTITDGFGAGKIVNLPLSVIKTTNLDGTTSYVYEMDFKATTLTGNCIILDNQINVTPSAAGTVTEWYVKYTGTATYANKTETVANVAGEDITFTVKKLDGVVQYTLADGGAGQGVQLNTPATIPGGAQTADVAFTLDLLGTVAPVVSLNATVTEYALSASVRANAYSAANGITSVTPDAANTTVAPGGENLVLDVVLSSAPTGADNNIVVNYTVNGVAAAPVIVATTGTQRIYTVNLPTGATTEDVTIVVTSVKLQTKITLGTVAGGANNITAGDALVVSIAGVTSNTTYVDVGSTVVVTIAIPAGRITGNGTIFTLAGESTEVEANVAATSATLNYVVPMDNVTVTPTAAAGNP